MNKKILFVDTDSVIVDFRSGLNKLPGEIEELHLAVHRLNERSERNEAN
jgi:hypothetical protein